VLITTTPYFANINSRFHESTPVLPKDDQTYSILPTRNNGSNGKSKDSRRVLLKLYKATNENGKWVNVQELPLIVMNIV
jgi:hypothetical protein